MTITSSNEGIGIVAQNTLFDSTIVLFKKLTINVMNTPGRTVAVPNNARTIVVASTIFLLLLLLYRSKSDNANNILIELPPLLIVCLGK